MKQLLILGGANFIGRNLLEELVQQNEYEITLFNRGRTNAELFPNFKRIIGDRNTDDVKLLADAQWDYVIDLSCYYPASLEQVLNTINKEQIKRYVFISTCSVYDNENDKSNLPTTEDGLLLTCSKEEETSPLPAAYGNKKVACEQLLANSGLDYISLRPGLVYGAHDYTDRLYYWLYQVKMNDTLLLPNNGEDQISITYVKDLVNATLKALTIPTHSNTYNVMSQEFVSIKKMVDTAKELLNKTPKTINAPTEFLIEQNIQQWTGMPLWINGDYFTYSNKKLLQDFELTLVDWTVSIQETINHYNSLNWHVPSYGISEEERQKLISLLS